MNKRKESIHNKDWYEVLNQNLKYVNKDFDNLDYKREEIMKEQYKLSNMQLIGSNFEDKYKPKKEIKNKTGLEFMIPDENKLIISRLNLKNYKTKNNTGLNNGDVIFLKDILEKIDKINTKKIFKKKLKNLTSNNNTVVKEFTFYNKSKYSPTPTSVNQRDSKILTNEKKEEDKNYIKEKINQMYKTYNKNESNNNNSLYNNNTYFPKIRKKKDKNRSYKSNVDNKRKIMRMIMNEEGDTVHRGKSVADGILQLNKDFIKNKRLICGYNDKNDDYIIINNKKIYQLNIEKEMNKNYQKNFVKIKKLKDIEQQIFNDSKKIFEATKKNLILKYQLKKKTSNNRLNEMKYNNLYENN
jgi:hypothetical protein